MSIRIAFACVLLGAPLAAGAQEPPERARHGTREGSTGGLGVVGADGGEPGSLRLQLVLDTIPRDDFLRAGTEVGQSRQAFSASWTALRALELYAALRNRGVTSEDPLLGSHHALGEWLLGAKILAASAGPVDFGADARFALRGNAGGDAIDLGATNVGVRGAASVDLRDAPWSVPFVGRFNVDYLFDHGAAVVEDVEAARYADLVDPRPRADEDAHLATRFERYALDVSRIDRFTLALGVEAPFPLAERTFLHPLLEWTLAMPVNRQGYDCPILLGVADVGSRASERDSCLASAGFASWPMRLALGARFVPPVEGLSALVAIDWALAGTETFTHELAPPAPFMVVFGVAFTIEPRPAPPPPPPEATAPPPPAPRGRVRGRVVAVGTGAAVADVAVRISGSETSAWLSDGSGHFTTEPLAPGEHTLSLTHATAEPGRCTVRVPDAGGDVEARCELVSRPPRSTVALHVVDAFGVPVSGALVVCSGPTQVTVTADPQGRVARDDLAPGAYQVRVEARGYLLHVSDLVLGSTKVEQAIVLLPRPSAAGVQVRGKRIVVPALRFEEDATSLGPEARLVAAELADLLLRTPEIARVRVTAGGEAGPAPLARAHAVREALLAAGVPEGRIEAAAGAGASGGVDVAIVE